ncbi:MAG TPA: hypothetical protein DD381_08340 [Lentisphaeria bacterium]|nr:MAG: hypothetical protein A2X47_04900 [Lentisphaerae bacterium GWF2_38_69]HBM16331.1 hypothetical protein [Lentisphaeria bacterium]
MLNEIYKLQQSLPTVIPQTHPDIKPLKKEGGLYLEIDSNGMPSSISCFSKKDSANLWNLAPSNHQRFPAINLSGPILECGDTVSLETLSKLKKEDTEKRKNLLKEIKDKSAVKEKYKFDSLKANIITFPHELKKLLSTEENNAFIALIDSLCRIDPTKISEWLKCLTNKALDSFDNLNLEGQMLIQKAFVGEWKQKDKKYEECTISVFLDIADREKYQTLVRSCETKSWVTENLIRSKPTQNINGVCALSGEQTEIEDDKFPDPTLPIIGPTYLHAWNKDIPCQSKYGKSSTEIIPISRKLASEFDSAMKFITDEGRKGKTWVGVPEKILLLSYLEYKPDSELDLAALLGGSTEENALQNFEAKSSNVIKAIKGLESYESKNVRIFALRKPDKGKGQIVLSDLISLKTIEESRDLWVEAVKNCPEVWIPVPPKKKGEKSEIGKPCSPYPTEIIALLQKQFSNLGKKSEKIQGCPLSDAFDFFLKSSEFVKDVASRLLSLLLQRTFPLLSGIGQALHSEGYEQLSEYSSDARVSALKTISLIAIALYKLDLKKEEYVNKSAYLIGSLLSAVDTLHKEYSKHVMKGKIPHQLIGNALISTALDNPESALAILMERIRPYQAWASTVTTGDIGLAKWCLKRMGDICYELGKLELPRQLKDTDKAQMLLGYLAKSE